jgi:hypothetical protein
MKILHTLARLFSIVFSLILLETSCGGGGGGSAPITPPVAPGGSSNQGTTATSPAANFYMIGGEIRPNNLAIFPANATGGPPPVLDSLAGCGVFFDEMRGIFVDTSGKIYLTGIFDVQSAGGVSILGPLQNGKLSQIGTITGPHTGLGTLPGGVAVDASGKIYVAPDGNLNAINIYAPGALGDAAPIATISGPHTQLSGPIDVKLDAQGNVYASNSGSITEYAAGATGDAAPIATIAGPNTGLGGGELAIDTKGRIFTTNLFQNGLNGFDWGYFPAGANGNVAPVQTFKDPCQFCGSTGIAVDGAGTVYTDAEFTDGTFVFRYPMASDGSYSNSNVVTINTTAETLFLSTAQIAVH